MSGKKLALDAFQCHRSFSSFLYSLSYLASFFSSVVPHAKVTNLKRQVNQQSRYLTFNCIRPMVNFLMAKTCLLVGALDEHWHCFDHIKKLCSILQFGLCKELFFLACLLDIKCKQGTHISISCEVCPLWLWWPFFCSRNWPRRGYTMYGTILNMFGRTDERI